MLWCEQRERTYLVGRYKSHRLFVVGLVAALALAGFPSVSAAKKKPPEETFDGLKRVPDSKAALVYVKPEAEFSVYKRLMILEPHVAFEKGWEREHRMGSSLFRVSNKDIEEIKERMAELFLEVFQEELEGDGGYPVVEKPAEDVLLLRPAIIDLDVTAPDVDTPGRSRSYVSSAGAATLFLELYDSVSGEILARAIDRKAARDTGTFRYSTRVSNSAEARRVLSGWARLLRTGLDEVHGRGQ